MYYYRRLRDLREDNDLYQKEIADILGITREQYQLYESGKREIKLNLLIKLADFYKVSTDYILGRTDNPEMNTNINKQVNITNNKESNTTINM